jgi:hypothetical protein
LIQGKVELKKKKAAGNFVFSHIMEYVRDTAREKYWK